MKNKFLIIDCYVDEPACLGVPPFVSPYPRYTYGALISAGVSMNKITFLTIDSLREVNYEIDCNYELVIIIGGAVVPGKYLGKKIGTVSEINKIINKNQNQKFAVGGLISSVVQSDSQNVYTINCDVEKFAYNYAIGNPLDEKRSVEEISDWSIKGAEMINLHPDFPNLICEIETSRGCPRQEHCSFCSEGLYENIEFRDEENIIEEINRLINKGIFRFRLGRQADILQYKTEFSDFRNGFPRPQVSPISSLFSELKNLRDRGSIKVLNIDNANPGTIANFPEESSQIIEIICSALTPGDTMALGFESFDPLVISKNNLKVSAQDAIEVIKIINQHGARRVDGIPILLPGINLLHGLRGEDTETFRKNYETLLQIKDLGHLVKRINIRKVQPYPGTSIKKNPYKISKKMSNRFDYYKNKIRDEIDNYMLKQIYPIGTILKNNIILDRMYDFSYGKQISSYSITLKIPENLELNQFHDALIIGHRERSLAAMTIPIHMNNISQKALESIPGIGKKRASEIILKRPFQSVDDLMVYLENVDESIVKHMRT